MELGTALIGAGLGGVIGAVKKNGDPWKYALWGGGIGLVASFCGISAPSGFRVGQLPQSLPTPGLPGQLVYNQDPRTDALLDPVSRQRLYPAWLLLHWQNGDRKVIADIQHTLGVPADGSLGSATTAALHAYQSHAGLPATGVMDRMTMEALVSG